jgi:hypothetical protein
MNEFIFQVRRTWIWGDQGQNAMVWTFEFTANSDVEI